MLPAFDGAHDLARSAAEGRGRIVGVQGQAHAGLFGDGDHGFQKVGDVGPHLVESVRAFVGERRQVLHFVVVERGEAGAGSTDLLVISFDDAMRVEIIFDYGQADLTGYADRLVDLFNFLVASGA